MSPDHDAEAAVPAPTEPVFAGVDPHDGTEWWVDAGFLASSWRCVWNAGCAGIGDDPDPDAGLGCCSVGAELLDDDEAMRTAAWAAFCEPDRFEHHAEAAAGGVFVDDRRRATRVVDGACIFLNRPGFAGGHGCALHLAALDAGESPIDVKPSVCWQLPLKVDRDPRRGRAVLRRWTRTDWGPGGATMAWCCTEEPEPYGGGEVVAATLAAEIETLVGPEVAVAISGLTGETLG